MAHGCGEFPVTAEAEKDLVIYTAYTEKASPSMAESMWDKDKLPTKFKYENWLAGPLYVFRFFSVRSPCSVSLTSGCSVV